jgi:hypothetical protein
MPITEYFYLAGGLLFGLVVAVGLFVVSLPRPEYPIARYCAYAAAILFGSITVVWGVTTPESAWIRIPAIGIAGFIAAVCLTEALRYIKNREFFGGRIQGEGGLVVDGRANGVEVIETQIQTGSAQPTSQLAISLGEFSHLSYAALRNRAMMLATAMREFEGRYSERVSNMGPLPIPTATIEEQRKNFQERSRGLQQLANARETEFANRFRSEALALIGEVSHRKKIANPNRDDRRIRALFPGGIYGMRAVGEAADFIEQLAHNLR